MFVLKKSVLTLLLCGCLLLSGCDFLFEGTGDYGGWSPPEAYEETQPAYDYEGFSRDLGAMIDANPAVGEGEYATGRLLVSADDPTAVSALGAHTVLEGPDNTYILQFSTAQEAQAAQESLQEHSSVAYAEPDVKLTLEESVSWGSEYTGAAYFSSQFTPVQTKVPVVAVVDSGVSAHQMLSGKLLSGWDFVNNDSDPSDENSHGTHVAGIVADAMSTMQFSILPVRCFDPKGDGYASVIGLGIRYAADHGAHVINMSFSGPHSSYKDDAITYALNKGCIPVAAAGNDKSNVSDYCPAHMDRVITVSALGQKQNFAGDFSNFGAAVDFCAPGVAISSANYRGGYMNKNGTSMAAPYVAAMAAMIIGSGMATDPAEVEALLISCCIDLGDPGRDSFYGHGVPDMSRLADQYYQRLALNNYWMLGFVSDASYKLYEVDFSEDGTLDAISMSDRSQAYGSFYFDGPHIYLTLKALDLKEQCFAATYGAFESVDAYYYNNYRGTYTLTKSLGEQFSMMQVQPGTTAPAYDLDPDWGPITWLDDGTYYIDLYVDGFRGDENCTVATTELRNFVQIDSATAYSLTPGTKLRVGDYTLDIEQVTFSTIDGVDYLDISGWEYAMYLPELGVWRFYGVNDQALTYSGGSANLLIPTTAQVWDYLTPFAYGHNVYGVDLPASYDLESDYFRLERVDDFYYWHQNAGSVGAYVTVKDGVITRLEIPYHP